MAHLLKEVHFLQDTKGEKLLFHTLRDKEKREVDFLITKNGRPFQFIEARVSETDVSPSLRYFKNKNPNCQFIQVVKNSRQKKEFDGIQIIPAVEFLNNLSC